MHFLFIITLCLTSHILAHPTVLPYIPHEEEKYEELQWPELKEDEVMDDFWKAVREYCSQEKKIKHCLMCLQGYKITILNSVKILLL